MKKIIFILILIIAVSSCRTDKKLDLDSYKTGTFIIPAGDSYSETLIKRIDSFQIETYEGKVDTLLIHWDSDVKYTLTMLNEMNGMEDDPIHVKITRVNHDSYEFEAQIGHSNFKQKGEAFKISE